MRRSLRHVRLRHLNRSGTFPSGNPRFYYRPKGEKGVPLPDLPMDHPEFLAAYAKAAGVVPRRPTVQGTLAEAVTLYKASEAFLIGLSASTRRARITRLDGIAERYGRGTIVTLNRKNIETDLSRFTGHARNHQLKAWKGLCAWAVDHYRLPANPSDGIKKALTPRTDGHLPWTADHIAAFRAHWPIGSMERLAFELIHWTGARVVDAVRLGEGNVDRDGWLTFKQQKTGGLVEIPLRRELPEFAEVYEPDRLLLLQAIEERPERHLTWLATRAGASRSQKSVSQWFAAKARAAGIEGRTAHGLRKSRAIALAEAGGTAPQIGAWTGHISLEEIERYIRRYDRRRALSRTEGGRESSNSPDPVPTLAIK